MFKSNLAIITTLAITTPLFLAEDLVAATLPPGLNPGEQFRYVFVTNGSINASSNNISIYNTFVNSEAASSGSQLTEVTGSWTAIASTLNTNARDNTGTTGSGGVPIFRLDGVKIADNYGDLWDGDLDNPLNLDQFGVSTNSQVWTGTDQNGNINSPLGNTTVSFGQSGATDNRWMLVNTELRFEQYPIYGISSIQEIPPIIPEPTTIIASMLLGGAIVPLKRRISKK